MKPTIKIDGKDIVWKIDYLVVDQYFDTHHRFHLEVSKGADESLDLADLQRILRKPITIEWAKNTFIGMIDSVTPKWSNHRVSMDISGYSPTFLMDVAPVFQAFSESSTEDIANEIMQKYSALPSVQFSDDSPAINWSVQHQETDFQYLTRLADANGHCFFYDGQKLYFDTLHNKENTIELGSNTHLENLQIQTDLCPLKFKVCGFDTFNDKLFSTSFENQRVGNNDLVKTVADGCDLYPTSKISLINGVEEEEDLVAMNEQLVSSQTNNLVKIIANSEAPNLKIGATITLNNPLTKAMGIKSSDELVLTQVTHVFQNDEQYSNSFSALPADFPIPIHQAKNEKIIAGPIMAKVIDNNDPENLGRVRVSFLMDENEASSPWLRVLTPFTSNQGFYFLPEIEEKVVVFSEDFNVEKSAFVMGSFYHKGQDAAEWSDGENKKKGISTGDIALLFDENNGELTIRAKSILFESTKQVFSAESITLESDEKVAINSQQKVMIAATQKVEIDGGMSLKQKAQRIDLN